MAAPGRGNYRSGRRRVPTQIHLLRGTRVRNAQREPVGVPGVPEPPRSVVEDVEALAHWRELAQQLSTMSVLTKAHRAGLALLALTLGEHDRVSAELHATGGPMFVTVGGREIENPLIRRRERLTLQATRLLGEFGLTPISSPKVSAHAATQTVNRTQRYVSG